MSTLRRKSQKKQNPLSIEKGIFASNTSTLPISIFSNNTKRKNFGIRSPADKMRIN